MTQTQLLNRYLYSFKYDYHHQELSRLESRQIFDAKQDGRVLFSDTKINLSISPFIKNRLELIASSENYTDLLENIKKENIRIDGFKVEYLVLDGDTIEKPERQDRLKDIGYCIDAAPNYKSPSITYAVCHHQNTWYFGELTKPNSDWRKHKKKPCSFSNSISMSIAKTLVSIATKGDESVRLLDVCCGVGTIMLEACYAGINVEGCDIDLKRCKHTRENLAHYQYTAHVYHSDIKDFDKKYDAIIIDLPYNLYSYSNEDATSKIVESTAQLAGRVVIVSISDISSVIRDCGLKTVDFCTVEKRGKSGFTRSIWVCEKEAL